VTATLFPVSSADVALTTDEWYTPRWLFDAAAITFDMDVCAPMDPAFRTCPARRYLTVLDDGATHPWEGIIWCNPPYSKTSPWIDRLAAHPDWLTLVPIYREIGWRRRLLQAADAITLLDVTFGRPDGSKQGHPHLLLLAARGAACTNGLARISVVGPYTGGAYHVRPRSNLR